MEIVTWLNCWEKAKDPFCLFIDHCLLMKVTLLLGKHSGCICKIAVSSKTKVEFSGIRIHVLSPLMLGLVIKPIRRSPHDERFNKDTIESTQDYSETAGNSQSLFESMTETYMTKVTRW